MQAKGGRPGPPPFLKDNLKENSQPNLTCKSGNGVEKQQIKHLKETK